MYETCTMNEWTNNLKPTGCAAEEIQIITNFLAHDFIGPRFLGTVDHIVTSFLSRKKK